MRRCRNETNSEQYWTSPPTRSTSTITFSVKHRRTRMISRGRGLQSVSLAATARHNVFIQKVSCGVPLAASFSSMLSRQTRDSCWTAHETLILVGGVHGLKRPSGRGKDVHRQEGAHFSALSLFRIGCNCLELECFKTRRGSCRTLKMSIRLSPSRKCFKRVLALAIIGCTSSSFPVSFEVPSR